MSTYPLIVVNPFPIVCDCPPGHGNHQHPDGADDAWCPILRRWYTPPRYGQLDYAIAGVEWRNKAGRVLQMIFRVDEGAVVVPVGLRGVPAGVFWCLCAHVDNARRRLAVPHG